MKIITRGRSNKLFSGQCPTVCSLQDTLEARQDIKPHSTQSIFISHKSGCYKGVVLSPGMIIMGELTRLKISTIVINGESFGGNIQNARVSITNIP